MPQNTRYALIMGIGMVSMVFFNVPFQMPVCNIGVEWDSLMMCSSADITEI